MGKSKQEFQKKEINSFINKLTVASVITILGMYFLFYGVFNLYLAKDPELFNKCNEACNYGVENILIHKWRFTIECVCTTPFSSAPLDIPLPDLPENIINIS